jgi:invasion protein IalB
VDSKRSPVARLFSCSGCAVALCGFVSSGAAQTAPPLTSAAVDPTIYRDGEVKRFSSHHGDWTVVCDEVTRLKQRFCSLRTMIVHDGQSLAHVTVSTGQDGRPSAMVQMLAKLVGSGALEISVPAAAALVPTPPKPATKPKSAPSVALTRLRPVTCTAEACTLIWTLKPEQISALNDGRGLALLATAGTAPGLTLPEPSKPVGTRLTVSARGFADAVSRSVQPFQ